MVIGLPKKAIRLLERFDSIDKKAYLVGGSVRDILLCRDFNDFDVCTTALPHETIELFSDCRVFDSASAYGTVTVYFEDTPFEITTMRKEEKYSDFRHPKSVIFTDSLEDDLARRDFTINALAADLNGNVFDCFDGISDLKNKIIRTVGNPDIRLNEDNLRVLRAFRFAVSLDGFRIEEKTLKECKKCLENGLVIPQDAIGSELVKAVGNITKSAEKYSFFLSGFCSEFAFDSKTFSIIDDIDPNDFSMRLALLFRNADSDYADDFLRSAMLSSKTVNEVIFLLNCRYTEFKSVCEVTDFYLEFGKPTAERALKFLELSGRNTSIFSNAKAVFFSEKRPVSLTELDISGSDLISLGLCGKEIGTALNFLLKEAAYGKVSNQKDMLISHLKSNFNGQ